MKKILSLLLVVIIFAACSPKINNDKSIAQQAEDVLKKQTLAEADWAMQQQPVTVTAETSARSAGGKHDFYSEGDYWWPNPEDPTGPYIQKDGMTNPENFVAHRLAMIRFSKIIGALASAYKITGNQKYVDRALVHLKAWFVNPQTRMNPNLEFAQAIKGRFTGRGIGIIDTIHLLDVAQGTLVMQDKITGDQKYVERALVHLKAWFVNPQTRMNPNLEFAQAIKGRFTGRGIGIIDTIHLLDVAQGTLVMQDKIDGTDLKAIKNWFSDYLKWLMTSKNGNDEMNAKNNHGTCFTLQVAGFAKLTGNADLLKFASERYKTVLLPDQMASDGSFPLEMARTKPYGYSIFNLDAMTILCQIVSTPKDNLFEYVTSDGKSIKKGIEFMHPFIADKSKWTLKPDVMYWKEWPVAQPALVFGANAYQNQSWFNTWKSLEHQPKVEEVIRNLPIKYPLLYL